MSCGYKADFGYNPQSALRASLVFMNRIYRSQWTYHLQLVQVLIVRQQSMCLSLEEIIVPNADESKDDGQVLFELGSLEVLVHLVGTRQELLEVIEADGKGDRETDGRPEGVAAADPVPEFEHVVAVNAESFNSLRVCRKCNKVLCDVLDL